VSDNGNPRADHDAMLAARLAELREEWKSWSAPERIEEHRVRRQAELLGQMAKIREKNGPPFPLPYPRLLDEWARWNNQEWIFRTAAGRRYEIEHEAATLRGDRTVEWPTRPRRDDEDRWAR
jgi:hypothetical protein